MVRSPMVRIWFAVLALMPAAVLPARSQEFTPVMTWSGELRLRSEADGRDFDPTTPPNAFTISRLRLALDAVPAGQIRVFVQAQDARVFGTESDAGGFSTLGDSRNLDLHQGYVEVSRFIAEDMTVRLGRQELNYGSERLVGAAWWHPVGRSFDGALLRLNGPAVTLDAFVMRVGEVHAAVSTASPQAVAYVHDAGQDFLGANAAVKTLGRHRMDFILLYQWSRRRTVPDADDLKRFTLGTYQKGAVGGFEYEAELDYQGGSLRGAGVSAFLVSGYAGISPAMPPFGRAGVGCDYLSGTKSGDSTFGSFDPMYHTGHKFYGFMDYFINIPANTGNRGLVDLTARGALRLSDQADGNIWLHHMALARESGGETVLGQELDLNAVYRYATALRFEAGASLFLPGPVMRKTFGSAGAGYWVYCATTVTF